MKETNNKSNIVTAEMLKKLVEGVFRDSSATSKDYTLHIDDPASEAIEDFKDIGPMTDAEQQQLYLLYTRFSFHELVTRLAEMENANKARNK